MVVCLRAINNGKQLSWHDELPAILVDDVWKM